LDKPDTSVVDVHECPSLSIQVSYMCIDLPFVIPFGQIFSATTEPFQSQENAPGYVITPGRESGAISRVAFFSGKV